MDKDKVWSTDDIIQNRNKWTLASDGELLKHLKSLSEKLISKSHSTLQLLNSFEDDVNKTCTAAANTSNRFTALSDTQFIENKIREDSPEKEQCSLEASKTEEKTDDTTVKLNQALRNGIQVLKTQYDVIEVTDSDSDGEGPREVFLKPRNPYINRRLPYIIGSEEFNRYDHLGLISSSEDEEDEKESEIEEPEDETAFLKEETPKVTPVKIDVGSSRTQVIRVSSDSEESEEDLFIERREDEQINIQKKNNTSMAGKDEVPKATYSFADHLNATLQNMKGNVVTPLVDDVLLPPPFPSEAANDSNGEENSDSSSDIIVSSKKITKSSTKPNYTSDIFDDEASEVPEINDKLFNETLRKSSIASNFAPVDTNKMAAESVKESTKSEAQSFPKPYTNVPNKNLFSAISAELNAKLNKKAPVKDENSSSCDENESLVSQSSSNMSKKSISTNSEKSLKPTAQNPSSINKKLSESIPISSEHRSLRQSSSFIDELFEDTTPKSSNAPIHSKSNKSEMKTKVKNLFDDDDSMDELFNPKQASIKQVAKSTPVEGSSRKTSDNFEDLFSSIKEKKDTQGKMTTSDLKSSIKKVNLFNDDSDSGDDIFAIINSQKKKSTSDQPNLNVEKKLFQPINDDIFVGIKNKEVKPPQILRDKIRENSVEEKREKIFHSDSKGFSSNNDSLNINPVKEREMSKSSDLFEKVDENLRNKKSPFDEDDNDDIFSTPSTTSENKSKFLKQMDGKGILSNSTIEKPREKPVEVNQSNLSSHTSSITSGSIEKNGFQQSTEAKVLPSTGIPQKKVNLIAIKENEFRADVDTKENTENSLIPPLENIDKNMTSNKQAVVNKTKVDVEAPVSHSQCADEIDNSVTNESSTNEVPNTKLPGKLAIGRNLNINVNALLPSANWSSVSKQLKKRVIDLDVGPIANSVEASKPEPENSSSLLSTIAKERPKISTRRRPPSRRARVSKALQSDVFATIPIENNSNDEPDNACKTASESNYPENNPMVTKNIVENLQQEKENTDQIITEDNISKRNEEFVEKKILKENHEEIFLPDEFVSRPTLTGYTKERAKVPRKRPSTVSKEKPRNITEPNTKSSDIPSPVISSQNENKTASDLENILISASSSREPPAIGNNDLKSFLNDSDDNDNEFDEDIFSDKSNEEPLPENREMPPLPLMTDQAKLPENLRSKTSGLFDEMDDMDDLFSKLLPPSKEKKLLTSDSLSADTASKNSVINALSFSKPENDDSVQQQCKSNENISSEKYISSTVPTKIDESCANLVSSDKKDVDEVWQETNRNPTKTNVTILKFGEVPPIKPSSLSENEELSKDKIIQDSTSEQKSKLFNRDAESHLSKVTTTKNSAQTAGMVDVSKSKNSVGSKKTISGLFDDDDSGDELFSSSRKTTKSQSSEISSKIPNSSIAEGKPSSTNYKPTVKPSDQNKTKVDLFADEDDDLFSTHKKSSNREKKVVKKNLFEDDEDDDNLFGSQVTSYRRKSAETSKITKSESSVEKKRIVKLPSQIVEKDPLSGQFFDE